MWAKIENGKITGICRNAPPSSEAGEVEAGWEQRSESDPGVLAYYQEQANPAEDSVVKPDMLNFRLDMLRDRGYARITAAIALSSTGALLVSRMENTLSFEEPHWPTVQYLWGQILNALPATSKPTATEAASWQAICQQRSIVAISFNAQGQIVLK